MYQDYCYNSPTMFAADSSAPQRIARKDSVWHWVRRGALIQLHFDLETGGVDRRNTPHPIRGYPVITEYGDAMADISGNFIDSMRVLPRRPERLIIDPAAPLVTCTFPQDYDSTERLNYFDAMAEIIWRMEHAAFGYDAMGDTTREVTFVDINKQAKENPVREDIVIDVPLRDQDGDIVHDVRWHPKKKKISYRVDDAVSSPYYEHVDNLCYIETDAKGRTSKWKWIDPSVAIKGFNIKAYDLAVVRQNLARVGVHPSNIPFLYSRATVNSKQRKKNYLSDVRHLALAAHLFGPQGEHGLQMGTVHDPQLQREGSSRRPSESLTAWLQANSRHENVIRGIAGGIFMPHDRSVHDPNSDHSAQYDALGSLAMGNMSIDIAPNVIAQVEQQANEDDFRRVVSQRDRDETTLPVFFLPQRDFPQKPKAAPYAFISDDGQQGRFGRYIFLNVDGTLRSRRYNDKPLHQLNVDEWTEYLDKTRGRPDAVIKQQQFRRHEWALPIRFVIEQGSASAVRADISDIDHDLTYWNEHPEMRANISSAIERLNTGQRFKEGPQQEILEDRWAQNGFGSLYQLGEDLAKIWEEKRESRKAMNIPKGEKPPPGIRETIVNKAQDDFNFLNMVDEALMVLCVTAHRVDVIPDDHPDAYESLRAFNERCVKVFDKFKKKNVPYLDIIKPEHKPLRVPNPQTGKNEKWYFETLEDARIYRRALALRVLDDFAKELEESTSDAAKGFVTRDIAWPKQDGTHRLLFANADRGETGGMYHVIDEAGRILPRSYMDSQEPRTAIQMLKERKWRYRFYRMASEPIIETILNRFVDRGEKHILSQHWQNHYDARCMMRQHLDPNEDETTARYSTLETFERDLVRLEQNAHARDDRSLQRIVQEQTGIAYRLAKGDEAYRIIAASRAWLEEQKRLFPEHPDLLPAALRDPETGLAYDYIPYAIPKEDHVVISVPAWHLRHPIAQNDIRLPFLSLVVNKPAEEDLSRIKKGTPVILREKETGRLYHPGPVSVHIAPRKKSDRFSVFNERAIRAYEQAGIKFPVRDDRMVLGIEGLYPIAGTRKVKAATQAIKVPESHFDGLIYPEIAGLEEKLSGLILPVDYCSQILTSGDRIRLQEAHGDMFAQISGDSGLNTGHIYDAKLDDVIGLEDGKAVGITLKQLFDDAATGHISGERMRACGFTGKKHMEQHLRAWTRELDGEGTLDRRVLLLAFSAVKPKNWAYFNPPHAPMAAMIQNNDPPSPSAYRDHKHEYAGGF